MMGLGGKGSGGMGLPVAKGSGEKTGGDATRRQRAWTRPVASVAEMRDAQQRDWVRGNGACTGQGLLLLSLMSSGLCCVAELEL